MHESYNRHLTLFFQYGPGFEAFSHCIMPCIVDNILRVSVTNLADRLDTKKSDISFKKKDTLTSKFTKAAGSMAGQCRGLVV